MVGLVSNHDGAVLIDKVQEGEDDSNVRPKLNNERGKVAEGGAKEGERIGEPLSPVASWKREQEREREIG